MMSNDRIYIYGIIHFSLILNGQNVPCQMFFFATFLLSFRKELTTSVPSFLFFTFLLVDYANIKTKILPLHYPILHLPQQRISSTFPLFSSLSVTLHPILAKFAHILSKNIVDFLKLTQAYRV